MRSSEGGPPRKDWAKECPLFVHDPKVRLASRNVPSRPFLCYPSLSFLKSYRRLTKPFMIFRQQAKPSPSPLGQLKKWTCSAITSSPSSTGHSIPTVSLICRSSHSGTSRTKAGSQPRISCCAEIKRSMKPGCVSFGR